MLNTETLPVLAGDLVTPDQPEWDLARRAWNLAVDQRPALVALPADAADVLAVDGRTRSRAGLKVAPQGTGPQRRRDRLARGHDPRLDAAHARRRDRRRGADRPRAGRHALARGHRGGDAARPVPALGLLARRRRRRLHARRRAELARAQARARGQPRDRDRARHPRRAARARDRRRARRPVLGAARRRRELRRRDRDGVPPVPVRRGLRRHAPVALRARTPRCCAPGATGRGRRRRTSRRRSGSCTSRRCPSCRRSCAAARSP